MGCEEEAAAEAYGEWAGVWYPLTDVGLEEEEEAGDAVLSTSGKAEAGNTEAVDDVECAEAADAGAALYAALYVMVAGGGYTEAEERA